MYFNTNPRPNPRPECNPVPKAPSSRRPSRTPFSANNRPFKQKHANMAPIPGLDPRQEAPVPPPANPYARPGPAQNPAQRPTPYSGGRVDVQKKGADAWRKFLNWFNDPGLGQDRTAVIIAVGIISLFVIGILAYLFITKKKKLAATSYNLAGVQGQLKESQDEHNKIQLDKALHTEPPTKEEDAEKAKIQEACDETVAGLQKQLEQSQAEVENLTKQTSFLHTVMQNFRR